MIWNWIRRRPGAVDVLLVLLLLAPTLVLAGHRPHTAAAAVLGTLATLPLLRRRQQPLLVLAVVTLVVLVAVSAGIWILPFQLGLALYTVATISERRLSLAAAATAVGATSIALAVSRTTGFGDAASRVVLAVALWLLGDSIGSRRAYVREIEEKASRLERERESESRRAVAEEQARIGRELHDVVAHALSVIVIQAAAADDAFDRDPGRAREPIRSIEAAARSALGDLRRVLGALQTDAGVAPQPGLGRLDDLVEQVRATGLTVQLQIEGTPRPLPAAVDLSAYRIVQEALTNTLKHAGAARADVRVRYGDDLALEIRDDGWGQGSDGGAAGSGLVGMRERVAMLGGSVDAGPGTGGGYRVAARIPLGVA